MRLISAGIITLKNSTLYFQKYTRTHETGKLKSRFLILLPYGNVRQNQVSPLNCNMVLKFDSMGFMRGTAGFGKQDYT
jgi:hypothetical protein